MIKRNTTTGPSGDGGMPAARRQRLPAQRGCAEDCNDDTCNHHEFIPIDRDGNDRENADPSKEMIDFQGAPKRGNNPSAKESTRDAYQRKEATNSWANNNLPFEDHINRWRLDVQVATTSASDDGEEAEDLWMKDQQTRHRKEDENQEKENPEKAELDGSDYNWAWGPEYRQSLSEVMAKWNNPYYWALGFRAVERTTFLGQ